MAGKTVVLLGLLFGSVAALDGTARGEVTRAVEDSSPQEVVEGIVTKAVRGVANISTGWLELPKQIYLTFKEDGVAPGIFIGPLKGIGMAMVRTATGVGETITFPIPFPNFYGPWFEPAYVWQKE